MKFNTKERIEELHKLIDQKLTQRGAADRLLSLRQEQKELIHYYQTITDSLQLLKEYFGEIKRYRGLYHEKTEMIAQNIIALEQVRDIHL